MNTDVQQPQYLSNDEMNAKLSALSTKRKIYAKFILFFLFLCLAAFITGIVFAVIDVELVIAEHEILWYYWLVAGVLLVQGCTFFGYLAKQVEQKKAALVEPGLLRVIRTALDGNFEVESYESARGIEASEIRKTELINHDWNRCQGYNFVKAKYRGVNVSFSNVNLLYGTNRRNDTETNIFAGQWLICELRNELPAPIWLRECPREKGSKKSNIQTDNIEFNNKYQITTPDQYAALQVLTPRFVESILNVRKKTDVWTSLCFMGNQLHIAYARFLFSKDVNEIRDTGDIGLYSGQADMDAKYITGIIDELLLNDHLFGSN